MKKNDRLGPAPTTTRTTPPLSSQRLDILDLVAARVEPCTVDQLAELAGLHPNTVRGHVDGLVGAGLVAREAVATGQRGRPSWRYSAVPERIEASPEYVGLAIALAEQVAAHSDDPAAVAQEAGRRWAATLPDGPRDRAGLLTILSDLGFAPETVDGEIRLTQCPLLTAARRNPTVVCGVHEGLIRARLSESERESLLPFAGPGYCAWRQSDDD